jgi:thioesterase domain-containing protein/acyl carrier protein
VYYTGDRGCYRPDGTLDILGRWDDQVKIRGVRIELEEVRIVLNSHPKIKQAAVLVREDNPGEKRLVAYIVLKDSSLPATEELRRALSEHLPNAMIPELFMPIDAMPLTPAGKLDRNALPVPELVRSILGSKYTLPGTAVEEVLTDIWQEVLMLDSPPGIHDDFFALGGHSLLSAHLVARIEETLDQPMPLHYFFAHPTIAELAKELDARNDASIIENSQPATYAAGPWQLVPGLYDKLLSYVGSWRGERATPDSLVIGYNTNGALPPLFWVLQSQHELSQLAAYLDNDQPLYGMRSGSAMMRYEELNIQTLALGYVEEIIALHPTGPLILGGNCQGGRIALAIAQHLLRRQREVSMLILMEWTYRPQPYGGPVTLLFGHDSNANPYSRFRYPELAWSRAFSDYHVEIISGTHYQFFDEPNIQDLVRTLEHEMACALEKPPRLLPQMTKQARLRVIDPPVTLLAGSRHLLQVEVQNMSTVAWARGEDTGLMLGNEWRTPEGKMVSQLDGRVPLPPLAPGEVGRVELPVVAPSQMGQINIAIELIEEGVRRYEAEAGTVRLALKLVDQT